MDFVIRIGQKGADAIECKINADSFEPAALSVFRSLYPEGRNYVISPNVKTAFQRRYGELRVNTISVKQLDGLGAYQKEFLFEIASSHFCLHFGLLMTICDRNRSDIGFCFPLLAAKHSKWLFLRQAPR